MGNQDTIVSHSEKISPVSSSLDAAEKGTASAAEKKAAGFARWRAKRQSSHRPPQEEGKSLPLPGKPNPAAVPDTIIPPKPAPPSLKTQCKSLHKAVIEGKFRTADKIMDDIQGSGKLLPSIAYTTQDNSGNGLLQIAALNGHWKILERLLLRSFNINNVDRNHGTALQAAIYMGQEGIYQRLLDQKTIIPEAGNSTLVLKIDVNTQGGYFGCALQVAAYKGDEFLVQKLVDQGANVNITGGRYGCPLQAAVRIGRMAVVKPILRKAVVNLKAGKYGTALQAVARGARRKRFPLPELSRGQPLKKSAKDCYGKEIDRKDANDVDYVEVAEALFSKGAQMDGGSGDLNDPINAATYSGSVKMLRLMLEKFDLDTKSLRWKEEKSLVLTRALLTAVAQSPDNQKELARLLVENGAKIQYSISEALPTLPIVAAANRGLLDVVNYLLEAEDTFNKSADILSDSGIHGTAMHAAIAGAKPGEESTAKRLIQCVATIWGMKEHSPADAKDSPNKTTSATGVYASTVDESDTPPPHHPDAQLKWRLWDTAYGNLLHLAVVMGLKATVLLLLNYGADPNVQDTNQKTALHLAALFGYPQIAKLLLDNGADINAKDESGATPLDQAEASLAHENHAGKSRRELEETVQILRRKIQKSQEQDRWKVGKNFPGPKKNPRRNSTRAMSIFARPFWNPGAGFRATIVDIWNSDDQERLTLRRPNIEDILHSRGALHWTMISDRNPENVKKKLRWIHIPVNNMTWAEMIINTLLKEKSVAYKSLWGTDSVISSFGSSPHTTRLAPQFERLVQDDSNKTEPNSQLSTLFIVLPYLHWEAYKAEKELREQIQDKKDNALKTSLDPKEYLQRENRDKDETANLQDINPQIQKSQIEKKILDEEDTHEHIQRAHAGEDYGELVQMYLKRRGPVLLRQRLDQYYYPDSMNGTPRDGDQTITKQFSEDKKLEKWPYLDKNSPVLLVDQLWLWIIDKDTIVTSFPHRQYDRDTEDLDPEDKTDILSNIISYLESTQRPPVDTAQELAELIIDQCVGVLQKPDVVPDLDFLQKYSTQTSKWADETIQIRSKFVKEFEAFVAWIKQQAAESEESIKRFEDIFSVKAQIRLYSDIQDTRDELGMLKAVFDDQKRVLLALDKHLDQQRSNEKEHPSVEQANFRSHPRASRIKSEKNLMLVEKLQKQLNEVYGGLKDLLDIKQQEAYVLEGLVSRTQAMSTAFQSKAIIWFTIVTIIFLPLTFITSFFALPIAEFQRVIVPEGADFPPTPYLTKGYALKYILGVTFAVAVPLILAAFEIQPLMMRLNQFRLKMAEKRKLKQTKKHTENDEMPDFLK